MNLEPLVRRCPQCQAIAHVKTSGTETPLHFYGCPKADLAFDLWEPVPHLDPRLCLGYSQWRAVHSHIVEAIEALPEDIRDRLPERLSPLRFADLEDAVIDGLVVVQPRAIADDLCLVAFGICPTFEGQIAWIGSAAPQAIGTTSEALLFETRLRLDMAVAEMLREAP